MQVDLIFIKKSDPVIEHKKHTHTNTHSVLLYTQSTGLWVYFYDYSERVSVSERAASHSEWLAVGLHISALNAKHMLMCGWESRE